MDQNNVISESITLQGWIILMAIITSEKNQDYRIIYLYKICFKIAVGNLRKMLYVRKYVIKDKKDTTFDCLCFSTLKVPNMQ